VNTDIGGNHLIDLASETLGAVALFASDEFFAPKERLTHPAAPVWRDGEYTDRGKWMDGWETRRRRDVLPGEPGFDVAHDDCVIKLAAQGVIHAIDVDTTHFKGNFPESCSLEACVMPGATTHYDLSRAVWHTVMERTPLRGDTNNVFPVAAIHATHVRLSIFPDGGVARLRVLGDVTPDWHALRHRGEIDLAAVVNGGRVVDCSDMFFGSRHNLIMPGPPRGMADGWETKRRRVPGHDWTIVKLGARGSIARVEVDTRHFKGNAPGACSVEACTTELPDGDWQELLPRTTLAPDRRHAFDATLKRISSVTHVRLNIFPDGGVARLHVFGRLE
jgi:allantoicase